MMRKLIYFLIFLIVVIAAIPFVDGYLYKKEYLRVMTGLSDKHSDKNIKFEIVEYHLGWLHSTIKSRIISTDPEAAKYLPDGFVMQDEVTHGPIVYDRSTEQFRLAYANIVSRTYLPKTLQLVIMPTQPTQSFIELNILATFNNKWLSKAKPITVTIPNMGTLILGESTATIEFALENDRLTKYNITSDLGAITFKSINASTPSVSLSPSRAILNSTHNAANGWNVINSFILPTLSITWADNSKLSAADVNANSKNIVDTNNLFQSNFDLNVKSINAPFFAINTINNFKSSFSLNNLNYAGLESYDKTSMDPQAAMQHLNKVFTPTSSLNATLSLNSSLGALLSSIKISIKSGADFTNLSMLDLMKATNLESNIKIADQLLYQLVIKYLEQTDAATENLMPVTTPPTDESPSDPVSDMTGTLYRDGKITLQQSLDIFGIISDKPDEQVFSQKITAITPNNAAQLTAAYRDTLAIKTKTATSIPGPVSREKRAQDMIMEWQNSGYLVKEGNDFVMDFVDSNGTVTVNGKTITPPTQ